MIPWGRKDSYLLFKSGVCVQSIAVADRQREGKKNVHFDSFFMVFYPVKKSEKKD